MGRIVLNGIMALYRLMLNNFFLYQFVDRIMRAKTSFCPRIFDVVIISVVFKGGLFEVIGCGRMKNWIVLCKSHQDCF